MPVRGGQTRGVRKGRAYGMPEVEKKTPQVWRKNRKGGVTPCLAEGSPVGSGLVGQEIKRVFVSLCRETSAVLLSGSWVRETRIRGHLTWRERKWGAVTT